MYIDRIVPQMLEQAVLNYQLARKAGNMDPIRITGIYPFRAIGKPNLKTAEGKIFAAWINPTSYAGRIPP